ncbi:hypothetical protein PAXRUDRAFT_15816 [Paxillus rubicundulus Ve08.2h10]|uniref:Uncharacterized protein n=1 Tax=Paxillus rubicundulus Ve08.2h10 TaxID=930991 RepID=A0A0D0DGL7_9AGAM|nr:hypothetical protein PAXRUDRAFT_15816 [Paxillus rubicundulus Ve08.2h10]
MAAINFTPEIEIVKDIVMITIDKVSSGWGIYLVNLSLAVPGPLKLDIRLQDHKTDIHGTEVHS